MDKNPRVKTIKQAQKESQLYREISRLFQQITLEDSRLEGLFVNSITLSPDKGMCSINIYTAAGKEVFDELKKILILYKPSLRKALADSIQARRVPDLLFKFDRQFDKQQRIEELLEQIKTEEEPAS